MLLFKFKLLRDIEGPHGGRNLISEEVIYADSEQNAFEKAREIVPLEMLPGDTAELIGPDGKSRGNPLYGM